jgi:regulator of protease activity HflC (stomatin/prohibitin superfamily)
MEDWKNGWIAILLLAVLSFGIIVGVWYGWANIRVYTKELNGKAQLREAEWSRQVAVEEARARQESAKLDAQAEIERAKGVREANEIIASSLEGNEEYLRYLWIDRVAGSENVIYVPTEASLPILEAGHR